MARPPSPQFIHEFELAPTPYQARILGIRTDLARQMYNAMLGTARARLNHCKSFHGWKQAMALFRDARRLAKQGNEAGAKVCKAEAKALQDAVIHRVLREERERCAPETLVVKPGATLAKDNNLKAPAPGIMTQLRQAHFRDHLDFKSVQGMAQRAYQTVDQLRFKRPTHRRDGTLKFPRLHFLRFDEPRAIDSTSIRWQGDHIIWNSPLYKLTIPVVFDPEDRHGIQTHALAQMQDPDHISERLRVLSRVIRGETRWYVQVTIAGHPRWKAEQYPPGHGRTVGIDFGPSKIGLVYQDADGTLRGAKLELAEGLRHDYARIRRLQRSLDRSRRATNPGNYNPDGTIKRTPGQRLTWQKSRRYQAAAARLQDLWRRYAAHRKNLLGRLANTILSHGTTIQIEQLSYKAWQKHWGKSIGRGAPGMLVRLLKQKAELLGGHVIEFGTRYTKFSQLCHGCGTYTKKPLAQRIHQCDCGTGPIDRDIYSAFLAYHFDIASSTLDIGVARATFAGLHSGAVDVQGVDQAVCVLPSVAVPSLGATGDCGGSTAQQALSLAEALGDQYPGERRDDTLTFQDLALPAYPASIEASMIFPGDARSDPSQENGPVTAKEGDNIPPRRGPRRQSSQEERQLSLFPGIGGPAG